MADRQPVEESIDLKAIVAKGVTAVAIDPICLEKHIRLTLLAQFEKFKIMMKSEIVNFMGIDKIERSSLKIKI